MPLFESETDYKLKGRFSGKLQLFRIVSIHDETIKNANTLIKKRLQVNLFVITKNDAFIYSCLHSTFHNAIFEVMARTHLLIFVIVAVGFHGSLFMDIARTTKNICDWVQCANGGSCQEIQNSTFGFQCNCAFSYTGLLCDERLNISSELFRSSHEKCKEFIHPDKLSV